MNNKQLGRKNFTITEAIFNEIQEVEFNWENYNYGNNTDVFNELAINETHEDISEFEDESSYHDAVFETLENIIFIGSISKKGLLYNAIVKWYEYKDKSMKEEIRSYIEDNNHIYFVTGYGYDTIDKDLLGGSADGMARKEFMQWING